MGSNTWRLCNANYECVSCQNGAIGVILSEMALHSDNASACLVPLGMIIDEAGTALQCWLQILRCSHPPALGLAYPKKRLGWFSSRIFGGCAEDLARWKEVRPRGLLIRYQTL